MEALKAIKPPRSSRPRRFRNIEQEIIELLNNKNL